MIAAVIPTRYHPPALGTLLTTLLADGVEPIVLRSDAFDHRIYHMWNVGVAEARERGFTHIAVLNDDVELGPGALSDLATALDLNPDLGAVYPDDGSASAGEMIQRTTGTWGAGGMTGFAFMFRAADALPAFDEAFSWWYGDDAWEEAVRAGGWAVARVAGVRVGHTPNGSASRDWDRLGPLVEADRARWEARA